MKIDKILNNNVVISKNGFGEEVVCMGKGLAFQKKIGDEISPEAVQKEFVLRDSFAKNQFQQNFRWLIFRQRRSNGSSK